MKPFELNSGVGENTEEREIAFLGSKHTVMADKEDMLKFLRKFDALGQIPAGLKNDPRVYGKMIGPKGNQVLNLQSQLKVNIYPEIDRVKITGTKEDIEYVKMHLIRRTLWETVGHALANHCQRSCWS